MSLQIITEVGAVVSFPRVSGDEPPNRQTERTEHEFSPRERG